jgi:integrase
MSDKRGRAKFTTRGLEAIQVTSRADFTDPSEKGLVFRVTPNGAKSWAFVYRRKADSKKRRVTLGEFPDMGLADARTKASQFRVAVIAGDDPAAAKAAFRKLETVDGLLDRYLKDYAEPRKRSAAEDRRVFKKEVRPAIGSHKIGTVTRAEVLSIINAMKDRGSGVGANRALAAIRKAFNWAKAEGYIHDNPAAGIAPRAKEQTRSRALTADEIKAFWTGLNDAAMASGSKLALKLALVTGQRIGEVAGALKQELNLPKSEWIIPASRSKNGREHSVPLSRLAADLFKEALKLSGESKYVFPSRPRSKAVKRDQPLASAGVSHAMADNLEQLGLKDNPATPHDLRRTVASHMAAMGIGENIVARVLNHASEIGKTITGSVYIRHSFSAEKRRALEAWADELDRIIRKRKPAANVVKLRKAQHG